MSYKIKAGTRYKITFGVLILMLVQHIVDAQTLATGPLASPDMTGDYYNNSSITLSQGFSTKAGGSFSAYIDPGGPRMLFTAPSANQNYIITYVPMIAGFLTTADLQNPTKTNYQETETIQYFDGLGRRLQNVMPKASPAGNDVVQPFAYDALGREAIKYLPYTVNNNTTGAFRPNALSPAGGYTASEQYGFYQQSGQNYAGTPYPYAQTNFEHSPLNRPVEKGAPGTDWQPGAGHSTRLNYTFNNNTSWATDPATSRQVALYTVTINDDGTRVLSRSGSATYAPNTLQVLVTQDENWTPALGRAGTTEIYKDDLGNVILERSYNKLNNTIQVLSTYHIYDNKGNLSFVLTPASSPDGSASPPDATLNAVCYQYQYDERNRMTAKRLPGKDWEYFIYNNADQMVASQDGNQRLVNQWSIIKYDGLGRVILTGLWNNNNSQIFPSAFRSAVYNAPQWDNRDPANSGNGYILTSYPQTLNTVLSVKYYDDYSAPLLPASYAGTLTPSKMTEGMLTATKTTVLNTSDNPSPDMLWSVNYYDEMERVNQTVRQHYYKGSTNLNVNNRDIVNTVFNFNNTVSSATRLHYNTSSPTPVVTLNNLYDYDQLGRKISSREQLKNGNNPIGLTYYLSHVFFNETGQLAAKRLHSTDDINFLQTIDYRHNEQGWLTSSSAPYFSQQLRYNLPLKGAIPQYNGNISEQQYNAEVSGDQYVTYQYDNLNRLLAGNSSAGYSETGIVYDLLGNLQSLTRNNSGTLNYIYQNNGISNQLASINGFKAGSYQYDPNGNVKYDGSRAAAISYNLLNLPKTVTATGVNLTYTYDADGNKLNKLSGTGAIDYISGIQYKTDGTVDFVQTEEGRALSTATAFNYEYTLTDHLGNNRVTFDMTSGKVTEDDYYPFGLNAPRQLNAANRYLYNNKELQSEITEYDYGARFYDPVVARWSTVDPLAEINRRWSPYNYVENNPIKHIDPDGMDTDLGSTTLPGMNYSFSGDAARFAFLKLAAQQGAIKHGDDYYRDRLKDFEGRNPGKQAPEYYLSYGNKYLNRFKYTTRKKLSEAGQKWLDKALINLQVEMDNGIQANPDIEKDNEAFTDFAFATHVKAYEDAGILELDVMDKVNILLSVDAKDLLSDRGKLQAKKVAIDQVKYYKNHPLMAWVQVLDGIGNNYNIATAIADYALKNHVPQKQVAEVVNTVVNPKVE